MDVPDAVRVYAGRATVRPVWCNESDGLTFAIGSDRFLKWVPAGSGLELGAESARLTWALPYVSVPPPDVRIVVAHSDACAPDTILLPDGTVSGHVDLGELGIADRWADLAVCSWSPEWNFGPGLAGEFFAGYDIVPHAERIRYYRMLWDFS